MANFVLRALEYGVLGLCAITLILVVGIIRTEQNRDGYPRRGIVHLSFAFMAFSVALAAINGFVQLRERGAEVKDTKALQAELDAASQEISDYKLTLAGLDGLIDLKVENEIMNSNTSSALRALAKKLKGAMDRARDKGLLDP